MAKAITLDEDLKSMNDFRYQCLVKTFGKAEADKIVNTSVNEKDITDKDLITVGTKAGLSKKFCTEDLELIKSETTSLAKYLKKTSSVKKHISWSDRLKEIAGSEENSQGQ